MKKLSCILAGAMLMSTLTLSGTAANANDLTKTEVSKASPHWGEGYIDRAKAEGILAGIGAEERDPEATVTRAEFVKMTLVAMRLSPGCETAERLSSYSRDALKTPNDMAEHQLTEDGYTEIARNFGLLNNENCADGSFRPDEPITRYDAAKIASRMAGLVYAANHGDGSEIPFTDAISESNVGTVAALAEESLLLGYEDNTMRGDNNISLAEACAILDRCIDYTEQGIDESIKMTVYSKMNFIYDENGISHTDGIDTTSTSAKPNTTVPVQIIDDIVYVPYIPVFRTANSLTDLGYFKPSYYPLDQKFSYMNGDDHIQTNIGSSSYMENESLSKFDSFISEIRVMRGEIMLPVYNIKTGDFKLGITSSYDPENKQIDLHITILHQFWGT